MLRIATFHTNLTHYSAVLWIANMPASRKPSPAGYEQEQIKMERPKKKRSKEQPIIFVLWGDGGEEVSAALFIKELRMAGRLVKLVGLGSTRIRGSSGLIFVPDLTLGEALELVHRAVYVILPFSGQRLCRFTNDPRLEQFIEESHGHGATFIQSDDAATASSLSTLFNRDAEYEVLVYPSGEGLYRFIRRGIFSP